MNQPLNKTLVKLSHPEKSDPPPEPQVAPWRPPMELELPPPRPLVGLTNKDLNRWNFLTNELGFGTYSSGACVVLALLAWHFSLPEALIVLTGIFGGVCFPICLLTVLGILARIRKEYWLVRHGAAAPGVIIRKEFSPCDVGAFVSAHYTFITVQGVKINGVEHNSWRIAGLSEGQTLTVLYDPRRPGRSILYAGSMYRAYNPGESNQADKRAGHGRRSLTRGNGSNSEAQEDGA